MLNKKHVLTQLIKITFVFIAFLLLSCKSQKEIANSSNDQKESTVTHKQFENNVEEEEKPNAVTPASINEQEENKFAKKKSLLLCSLMQLKTDLGNTNDNNQKTSINTQILQLKDQINELDKEIEATFPDKENKDRINKLSQYLAKDC